MQRSSVQYSRPVDYSARDSVTATIRDHADLLAITQDATGNRMRRTGSEWRGPCPLHGGEGPNFCVNPDKGVFSCFVCGESGDVFDFVRLRHRVDFPSARQWLADRAGISLITSTRTVPMQPRVAPTRQRSAVEIRTANARAVLEALRSEGCMPSESHDVYASVCAMLPLGAVGADYLAARGFDPDAAAQYGFRSVDSAEQWRAFREDLDGGFLEAELQLAGLSSFPWRGDRPALVIPYVAGGRVIALRFRSLVPNAPKDERYCSLRGAQPSLPFNADAITEGTGPLHIVEGEVNAYTLTTYGLRAIGLPGAATWRDEWAPMLAQAVGSSGLLVAWYDDDDAGTKARAKLARRLQDALGAGWLARHGVSATLRGGDANALHVAGTLRSVLEQAGVL